MWVIWETRASTRPCWDNSTRKQQFHRFQAPLMLQRFMVHGSHIYCVLHWFINKLITGGHHLLWTLTSINMSQIFPSMTYRICTLIWPNVGWFVYSCCIFMFRNLQFHGPTGPNMASVWHWWRLSGDVIQVKPITFSSPQTAQNYADEWGFMTGWWFHPLWKYESQLAWFFSIYGKIKAMFQTTNQIMYGIMGI